MHELDSEDHEWQADPEREDAKDNADTIWLGHHESDPAKGEHATEHKRPGEVQPTRGYLGTLQFRERCAFRHAEQRE